MAEISPSQHWLSAGFKRAEILELKVKRGLNSRISSSSGVIPQRRDVTGEPTASVMEGDDGSVMGG